MAHWFPLFSVVIHHRPSASRGQDGTLSESWTACREQSWDPNPHKLDCWLWCARVSQCVRDQPQNRMDLMIWRGRGGVLVYCGLQDVASTRGRKRVRFCAVFMHQFKRVQFYYVVIFLLLFIFSGCIVKSDQQVEMKPVFFFLRLPKRMWIPGTDHIKLQPSGDWFKLAPPPLRFRTSTYFRPCEFPDNVNMGSKPLR